MSGAKGTDVGPIVRGGKEPSGGGQTSGEASNKRVGTNYADAPATFPGFPGAKAKSQGDKTPVTGQSPQGTPKFPKKKTGQTPQSAFA